MISVSDLSSFMRAEGFKAGAHFSMLHTGLNINHLSKYLALNKTKCCFSAQCATNLQGNKLINQGFSINLGAHLPLHLLCTLYKPARFWHPHLSLLMTFNIETTHQHTENQKKSDTFNICTFVVTLTSQIQHLSL